MCNEFVVAVGAQSDLAYRKPFAELEYSSLGEKIARAGLFEKVDAEIGGDRERNPADRGQDGQIHREIGERHHDRPGHGSARPQRSLVMAAAHAATAVPDFLDLVITHGVRGFREFGRQELHKLLAREFGRWSGISRGFSHGISPGPDSWIQ